ncbi:MAG TPA: site-specific integrase [Candidatus Mediterraneibacter stercoripullorum]|nr:site-specific integrase [Candidatus Mediterraneibacter stercoripullorum]
MQNITAEIKREQIGAFREYLNQRENADATIKKYITDISTFLRYLNNESTIDKQKLLDYKEWLLRRYAVSSVNSMLAALNQFLEFLNLSFLKVKRVKVQNNLFLKDEKELTKDEYRRLVKTAAEEGREQLALCIETIASTGIRISELEFFTVESVRRDYIEIVNKGKYRRIFLPKVLRQKLILFARKHGVQKGAIFVTRNGKPKNRSNIWREMKALEEKAGISGNKVFPHNLRHLFARIYYSVTKDLAGLADLLGHSSLNVTRIYTSNTGKIYQKQLDSLVDLRVRLTT